MVSRRAVYGVVLGLLALTIAGVVLAKQSPSGVDPVRSATTQVAAWERAEITNLGPVVNSKYRETGLAVTGDGRTLYFVSDRPGGVGGRDIWVTTRKGKDWTPPVNLGSPVNSPANDGGLSISADGKTLFFTSDRKGGLGGEDLYVTKLVDGRWTEPVNLGDAINTRYSESMAYITKNDRELLFHSDRPGGFGGTDIYVSRLKDGRWQRAVNLGPQVNSQENERNAYLSNDGLSLYFGIGKSRFEPDPNERMRIATRTSVTSMWIKPITFGPPINIPGAYQSCTEITNDGKMMFFISNRRGAVGQDDVWMAQRP